VPVPGVRPALIDQEVLAVLGGARTDSGSCSPCSALHSSMAFEGAPHGLLWTHADEVNEALLAFVAK
jgi:hypothetical protein